MSRAEDAAQAPGPRAALGANFWRLWSASAASNLADGVFRVALPLLALTLTRSPSGGGRGDLRPARLPWLLFALQAGALADRLDRRRHDGRWSIGGRAAWILGTLTILVATRHSPRLPILYRRGLRDSAWLETLFDTSAQSIMPSVVERRPS